MKNNYSNTHFNLHRFHFKSKYFADSPNNESFNYWNEKVNYFEKSFALSVFLSSIPILMILFLIFLFSCIANLTQKWMLVKRNKDRWKKIEKFKILLELNEKIYMDSLLKEKYDDNVYINKKEEEEEEEEEGMAKIRSNLKRKSTHPYGLSELYIPDENKVPIVLLNEAIARASFVGLSYQDDENAQIGFDPKIAQAINELCHPKFVLSDEEENSTSGTIIKSDDEFQMKIPRETKDSTAPNSEDDRKNFKSNRRRKSSNPKKKVSKKISKSSDEDDGFNIKTIGKLIFKSNDSTDISSDDNKNLKNFKTTNKVDDLNIAKYPDIKIYVEDFDEIKNHSNESKKYEENLDLSTITIVREDRNSKGKTNQSYEKEDV